MLISLYLVQEKYVKIGFKHFSIAGRKVLLWASVDELIVMYIPFLIWSMLCQT